MMGNWEIWFKREMGWTWHCHHVRRIFSSSAIRLAKRLIEANPLDAIVIKHRITGREAWAWRREGM